MLLTATSRTSSMRLSKHVTDRRPSSFLGKQQTMDKQHSFSSSINGSTLSVIPDSIHASLDIFQWHVACIEALHDTVKPACGQ